MNWFWGGGGREGDEEAGHVKKGGEGGVSEDGENVEIMDELGVWPVAKIYIMNAGGERALGNFELQEAYYEISLDFLPAPQLDLELLLLFFDDRTSPLALPSHTGNTKPALGDIDSLAQYDLHPKFRASLCDDRMEFGMETVHEAGSGVD